MQEELQKLYNRATILEPETTKQGRLIRFLYSAATNDVLPYLEGANFRTREDALEKLEFESANVVSNYADKIEPLREKHKLIDDVASGKTRFFKKYRDYFIWTHVNKENFTENFGIPFGDCYNAFEGKELNQEDLYKQIVLENDTFRSVGLMIVSYVLAPFDTGLSFALSLVLSGKKSIECQFTNKIKYDVMYQDKKMSALYNLTQ